MLYIDFDPYFETPQSSETEEVVSDYDSDDLYSGSVFYLDEEDNAYNNKKKGMITTKINFKNAADLDIILLLDMDRRTYYMS